MKAGILENACTVTRPCGHGQADTDTYGKDGQLWRRWAVMEKTDAYGKDGHKAFKTNFLSFKKEAHIVL